MCHLRVELLAFLPPRLGDSLFHHLRLPVWAFVREGYGFGQVQAPGIEQVLDLRQHFYVVERLYEEI